MKLILVVASLLIVCESKPVRHGQERIVIQHEDNSFKKVQGEGKVNMQKQDDGMQFKSFSGNETDSMFQTVKGDDMNFTMQEANITTTGYVSDDVKEQQQFHHYNNTNFFVTFREQYLKQKTVKEMANELKTFLTKSGKVKSARVKKLYQSYAILSLSDQEELRAAADLATASRPEVLACEWHSKKRIFGVHANINEMAKFKTKIRKAEEIDGTKKKSEL